MKKIFKNSRLIIFLIVVIVMAVFVLWTNRPQSVSAAWFDDSWGYRNAVPITVHTAAESNVYILVTINSTSNFQADCGDLRWTDMTGQLLDYYVVSGCGGASTIVQVFFPYFPAGLSNLYYYYGNPSAPNGFSAGAFSNQAANYTVGSIGSQEKANGPVGFWKLDEGTGTTTKDSTANNYTGTLTNMSSTQATNSGWVSEDLCVSGKCLAFDGNNDYVDAGLAAKAASLTNTFSVSVWFKSENLSTGAKRIISTTRTSSNNGWGVGTTGTNLRLTTYAVKDYDTTKITLATNQWYFLEVVLDSSNTANFYVNGKLIESVTNGSPGTSNTDDKIYIGATTISGGALTEQFFGFIDEPKVYNYARTAAQIQADYNSKIAGTSKGASAILGAQANNALNQGMVGYWKMDESSWNGTAREVKDSSGAGNDGTAVNSATTTNGGKFGSSGLFTAASSHYVSISDSANLSMSSESFSVSSWVYLTTKPGNNMNILTKSDGVTNEYVLDWKQSTDRFRFVVNGSSQSTIEANTFGAPSTGTWYFVVGWYDYSNQKIGISVNGLPGDVTTHTGGVSDLSGNFLIGAYTGSLSLLNGRIDEARVYKRLLSPDEITQLYNFAPGPVAYWKFEEKQGSTVNDTSGYGYNTTWVGGNNNHWVSGKFGTGGNFDGATDEATVANNLGTSYANVTIETWAYISSTSLNGAFIKIGDMSGSTAGYAMGVGSGNFDNAGNTFIMLYEGIRWIDTSTTIGTGWHHFVMIVGSDGNPSAYLDGKYLGAFAGTVNTLAPAAETHVGGYNAPGNRHFKGVLDETKVYNYVRTQQQIYDDMKGTGSNITNLGGNTRSGALAGYWKFDEGYGTTANDSSGNNNVGTLTTMASPSVSTSGWSQNGKIKKALSFDGSDDKVSFTSKYNFTEAVTISTWFNTRTKTLPNAHRMIFGTSQSASYLSLITSGSAIPFLSLYIGGTQRTLSSNFLPNTDTWYFVTATYDGATIKIYINGILKNSAGPYTGTLAGFTSGATNYIGAYPTSAGYEFSGSLDEVKIYPYALTADEVKTDYNQGSALVLGSLSDTSGLTGGTIASNSASAEYCVPGDTTSCNAPLGRWDFEEGQGSSANDSSGNINPGTLNCGASCPKWAPNGAKGRSIVFSPEVSSDRPYVSATSINVAASGGSAVTVAFWAKPTSSQVGGGWMIRNGTNTDENYGINLGSISGGKYQLVFTGYDGGSFRSATTTGYYVVANAWNHIEAVFTQNSNVLFYVNGVLTETLSYPYVNVVSASNLVIGANPGAFQNYNGYLDNIRIYNYARTTAQVAWDYNRGGPVGWWKMDECQGSVLHDSSGNGINGTLFPDVGDPGTCTTNATTMWYNGRSGKFNSSLNFDGTADYVDLGSPTNLGLSGDVAYTLSVWVKPSAFINDGSFISYGDGDSGHVISINSDGGGNVYSVHYDYDHSFEVALTLNQWQHLLTTYDPTTSTEKLYVNGVFQDQWSPSDLNITPGESLRIGQASWNGTMVQATLIDEAKIFNYALTPVQIRNEYNQASAVRFGPSSGSP